MAERARWYVVHTYSGYENKVKATLEKTVENRDIHDLFQDIQIPLEEFVETKDGKRKITLRKKFPGYVLIKMIMSDETWYIVRNTRGVTGFVGPNSKAVPLSDDEVRNMGIAEKLVDVDFSIGEKVQVISGPLENFEAEIQDINLEKQKVKASVSMFGRDTLAELDFHQIKKLD